MPGFLLVLHFHNHRIVVAAQFQVERVVVDTFQCRGVENIVDAQQAFTIAVGVHVTVSGTAETVFQKTGQGMVGVRRRK